MSGLDIFLSIATSPFRDSADWTVLFLRSPNVLLWAALAMSVAQRHTGAMVLGASALAIGLGWLPFLGSAVEYVSIAYWAWLVSFGLVATGALRSRLAGSASATARLEHA